MYDSIRSELAYDGSGETSGIRAGARPLFDCHSTQPRTPLSVTGNPHRITTSAGLKGTYKQALIQVYKQLLLLIDAHDNRPIVLGMNILLPVHFGSF